MSVTHRRLRSTLDHVRNPRAQILAVLVFAVALRLVLYDAVAIRGDLGYWLLDGEMIVDGRRPFFGFVGRSPLFLYSYSAARAILGPEIWVFRWFVAGVWMLAALVLYRLARTSLTHKQALAGMAAFVCSPFAIAFGFYSSSQSLGVFCGALALLAVVRHANTPGYAVSGLFVGLAFLSRRSLVLLGPAVVSWLAVRWWRGKVNLKRAIIQTTALTVSFLGTLMVFYFILARGSLADTVDLFLIHLVNLFISTGSGGVPLLSMAGEVAQGQTATATTASPLAPLLDSRSRSAFMAVVIGGLPLLAALSEIPRYLSQRYLRPFDRQLMATAWLAISAFAVVTAVQGGYFMRAVWVGAAVCLATLLWRLDGLSARALSSPAIFIGVLAWLWVTVGYFIRPNLLAAYYAMDALPFLIPLTGAAAVTCVKQLNTKPRTLFSVVVVVLVIASSGPLSPLAPATLDSESRHDRVSFFTPDKVQRLGDDLDRREASVVLTSQPNYVATSDAVAFERNTRALYISKVFGDSGPMLDYYARLNTALGVGHIGFVVWDEANRQLLTLNASVNQTFHENYCPVDGDGLYRSLNATLYRYGGECTTQ